MKLSDPDDENSALVADDDEVFIIEHVGGTAGQRDDPRQGHGPREDLRGRHQHLRVRRRPATTRSSSARACSLGRAARRHRRRHDPVSTARAARSSTATRATTTSRSGIGRHRRGHASTAAPTATSSSTTAPRARDDQRRRRRRRAARRLGGPTRSTATPATTRSTAAAASTRSYGGDGDDLIRDRAADRGPTRTIEGGAGRDVLARHAPPNDDDSIVRDPADGDDLRIARLNGATQIDAFVADDVEELVIDLGAGADTLTRQQPATDSTVEPVTDQRRPDRHRHRPPGRRRPTTTSPSRSSSPIAHRSPTTAPPT